MFVSSTRERIRELLDTGKSQAEVARQLGLAVATVDYHVRVIRAPNAPAVETESSIDPRAAVSQIPTRAQVLTLLQSGLSRSLVARLLGLTKPTVSYHARRLGLQVDERCARRYDWRQIQRYYDDGHSVRECCGKFGCSRGAWHDAMRRGALITRPAATPTEELFAFGTSRNRSNLKRRLIDERIKEPRCEACGLSSWREQPLSLALHHANGDRHDNRLENLHLLCPNCHSQTDTFAGRRRPPVKPP
jgi:DNA-binding CsgD family transcriptional regulator